MILYALVAAVIVILFLTIPALRRTKYTIVNERMAKNGVVKIHSGKNVIWIFCYYFYPGICVITTTGRRRVLQWK